MRALVILTALLWAASASAQTRTLASALSVPEGATCLTHDALVEHTASWLGTDSVDARRTILIELGEAERAGVAFALLDGETLSSRRRFSLLPEACADRRAALSLALAIALDASVLGRLLGTPSGRLEGHAEPRMREPVRSSVDGEEASAPGEPTSPASLAPQRSRLPSPDLSFRVGVAAGVRLGLLPKASPWGSFSVALSGPGWTLRALAGATAPAHSSLADAHVRSELLAGAVEACLDRDVGPLALSGCLGPRLGRVFASGRGFATSRSVRLWWLALGAGLHARYPRDAIVSLDLRLGGQLGLLRPVLRVTDADGAVTHRLTLGRVGLGAGLGVTVTLR